MSVLPPDERPFRAWPNIADAKRIVIIGPPGTGKGWLARELGHRRDLPVEHLDEVGHVAGGGSPLRPPAELQALLDRLRSQPGWICEGVDLDWTRPLLEAADTIVWLDEAGAATARRLVRRFIGSAFVRARRERSLRRLVRPRDYARQALDLARALVANRGYARARPGADPRPETHDAFATALIPFEHKAIRCVDADDRRRLLKAAGQAGSS